MTHISRTAVDCICTMTRDMKWGVTYMFCGKVCYDSTVIVGMYICRHIVLLQVFIHNCHLAKIILTAVFQSETVKLINKLIT